MILDYFYFGNATLPSGSMRQRTDGRDERPCGTHKNVRDGVRYSGVHTRGRGGVGAYFFIFTIRIIII